MSHGGRFARKVSVTNKYFGALPVPVVISALTVGSGKNYATIAAANAVAVNGDTIQVYPGTYANDYINITKNITITGMGATPDEVKFTSSGLISNGKAMWLTNATVSISNIEMSGATVSDGNGEAIRQETGNLTLTSVWIHDCETGFHSNNGAGSLVVDGCEMNNCGTGDVGQTHNFYAGSQDSVLIKNSFFHDCNVGHQIKSRALTTTVQDSRLFDNTSSSSYSVDISQGGIAIVQRNIIQQGALGDNPIMISFAAEGSVNPSPSLLVSANTFINDLSGSQMAVNNHDVISASVINNSTWGLTSGQILTGTGSVSGTTTLSSEPSLNQAHPWLPASSTLSRSLGLQNTSGSTIPSQPITFGQTFLQGEVAATSQLTATIDSVAYNVQLDAKVAWTDGSCKFGVLAFKPPAISGSTTKTATLTTRSASGSAIALTGLVAAGYDIGVTVAVSGGSTYTYNVGTLLTTALSGGNVTYWQQGPQVTEGRIDQYLTNALHIIFDIAWFADGTHRTVIQFCNDYALQASGGTLTYNATITRNGVTFYTISSLVHYQYSVWSREVWSSTAPTVHLRHDSQKLMDSKLVHNFMLTVAPPVSLLTVETDAMAKPLWGSPLVPIDPTIGAGGNYAIYGPQMGDTGARPDIGPITSHQVAWLQTQNETQLTFILGQAEGSGSLPVNFFDPATKLPPSIITYPNLRARQDGGSGTDQLTQPIPLEAVCKWAINVEHHPALTYVPYLATGKRYFLDRLNAFAGWCLLDAAVDHRGAAQGILLDTYKETRGQAWTMRSVQYAAWANPDGSAAKTYFTTFITNNYANFVNVIMPYWTPLQGETYGVLRGDEGENGTAGWQQGYTMSTIAAAVENGVGANAVSAAGWVGHFLIQGVLAPTMNPYDMACYFLTYYNDPSPTDFGQSPIGNWAGVEAATITAGHSNGSNWTMLGNNGSNFAIILEMGLGILVTIGVTNATSAYNWLVASNPPVNLRQNLEPNMSIIPRV